jgi:hypothetical protein
MTVQSKLPLCSKTKEIRLFREADVEKFEQLMGDVESRLSDMYNVENMWSLFESTFRKAIEVSVPTKTVNVQSPDQPPWFNKRTKKLVENKGQHIANISPPVILSSWLNIRKNAETTQKYSGNLRESVSQTRCVNH